MDGATGPQQVRVHFTTLESDLQLPEGTSELVVPADFRRINLSKVLNSEGFLNSSSPIPLEFLINGTFLRTPLDEFLREHGLSLEHTLTLQYVRSLLPPIYQASFEHDDWISHIDVSTSTSFPQGQERALTASYDGLLRTWNSAGQVVATSPSGSNGGHTAAVKCAKFISASQVASGVASGGMDNTVRVWKYAESPDHLSGDFKPILELYGHTASVDAIDVHNPTNRILSASADGAVGLWTMSKTTAPAANPELLPGAGVNVAKKRKIAASAPQRGPLSLMQIHSAPATAAIFHPDDPTVAYSASEDHTIRTIDLTTSLVVSSLSTSHPLLSLCAMPAASSSLLAAGTSARHITLADPRASATTASVMTLRGHRNLVTSLSPSPHNAYSLASGSHDGTCRIWDIRSVRPGTRDEGGGSVCTASHVIEREGAGRERKRSDVPGLGCKVLATVWDGFWGVLSGGEDRRLQVNGGEGLMRGS